MRLEVISILSFLRPCPLWSECTWQAQSRTWIPLSRVNQSRGSDFYFWLFGCGRSKASLQVSGTHAQTSCNQWCLRYSCRMGARCPRGLLLGFGTGLMLWICCLCAGLCWLGSLRTGSVSFKVEQHWDNTLAGPHYSFFKQLGSQKSSCSPLSFS